MTIKSGFFNSVNGDRKYSADNFAQYFASFIGNGVFPAPSTSLQVAAGTNMTTVVKAGKGWINGYFVVNDSDYVLQHDISDGILKRIDRVVMRLNNLTRQIEITVKKGTSASNPVAPTLQRDTDFVELALADVLINNGATTITQDNITDTRLNNNLCGIVHGTVEQVDTTTLFNQYQSWYSQRTNQAELDLTDFMQAFELTANQWMQQEQQDFETWFATLQDLLDENIAATLTAKVQALENNKANSEDLNELKQQVTAHLAEDNEEAHSISNIVGLRDALDNASGELTILKFDNPGNFTWTVPDNVTKVYVSGCGGGGSGGQGGSVAGQAGGATSFGNLITLTGGGGGQGGAAGNGGLKGGDGGGNGSAPSYSGMGGRNGGDCAFGIGGSPINATDNLLTNLNASGFGSGGAGSLKSSSYGGGGGGAECVIEKEVVVTPKSSITITVAAGGSGGGIAGNGANGLLIIKY